jgi:hypothetical protein
MLEAEVEEFISGYAQLADAQGKPRVVRNGYLPERKVRTALGKVPVKIPRVRDRLKADGDCPRIKFNSKIISPYQRRTSARGQFLGRFLTELNRGDLAEAAAVMLGTKREFVTPAIVSRLQESLKTMSGPIRTGNGSKNEDRRFRYVWVDRVRSEADSLNNSSLLVAIGETDWGEKSLLLVMDQQSTGQNLYSMLVDELSELGVSSQAFVALSDECWVH